MLFGISKTSIRGVLQFLITTFTVLGAIQVPAALVPGTSHVLLGFTFGTSIALALCSAWVGLLQGDAPVQSAKQNEPLLPGGGPATKP